MVFPPPISKPETPPPPPLASTNEGARRLPTAASSATMSQPLHNFPLSDLKWSMNQTNTHRVRKAAEKLPDPVAEVRRVNPPSEKARSEASASSFEMNQEKKKGTAVSGSDRAVDKKSTEVECRSKILIRIPNPKNNKNADASAEVDAGSLVVDAVGAGAMMADAVGAAAVDVEADAGAEDQILSGGTEPGEAVTKTWNLRPRKPPPKRSNGDVGGALNNGRTVPQDKKAQGSGRSDASRPRNRGDAKIAEGNKEKKHKLSISLTKMEIDEDIFALTGSKPSRRPKKRAKHVQKQLDGLFPGLWLGSITPDAYKVSEHTTKG